MAQNVLNQGFEPIQEDEREDQPDNGPPEEQPEEIDIAEVEKAQEALQENDLIDGMPTQNTPAEGEQKQESDEEEKPKKKKKKVEKPKIESEADQIAFDREKAKKETRKKLMKALVGFVKYNQKLYHLDLTHTGLNELMIKKIGTALNKARSLVGIHLSDNPGITERNLEFLKDRIRCRDLPLK